MNKVWILEDNLERCPKGWRNFITYLRTLEGFSRDKHSHVEEFVRDQLLNYHAKLVDAGKQSYLVFSDEKYYTLFLLKYGGEQ